MNPSEMWGLDMFQAPFLCGLSESIFRNVVCSESMPVRQFVQIGEMLRKEGDIPEDQKKHKGKGCHRPDARQMDLHGMTHEELNW